MNPHERLALTTKLEPYYLFVVDLYLLLNDKSPANQNSAAEGTRCRPPSVALDNTSLFAASAPNIQLSTRRNRGVRGLWLTRGPVKPSFVNMKRACEPPSATPISHGSRQAVIITGKNAQKTSLRLYITTKVLQNTLHHFTHIDDSNYLVICPAWDVITTTNE